MTRERQLLALSAIALAAACSDATQPVDPAVRSVPAPSAAKTVGGENYVAIGTSISMGWASNGVYEGSQAFAWPALMRFGGGGPISLPLIQSPGCWSPLVAPLGANMRLSGEGFSGSSVCAPNEPGVQLPTQDVALAGALAGYALFVTPAIADGAAPWYSRVLPPGMTQVSAALSQNPTLVSVELGGNDILGTLGGRVVPGATFTPLANYEQALGAVLDAVGSVAPKVLVVGMSTDGTNIPALRRGDEIWADREEFAALHVDVSADCDGSPNYINASVKSLIMVFTGAFTSTHGLPNPVYSCADIPSLTDDDFVLTPADITFLNGMLVQMRDFAQQQAAARGYAFTTIGALYDRQNLKPPVYSVISQLTSGHPYGPYISLDGVHPFPLGESVLARAAANALNKNYPGIAAHAITVPPAFGEQLVEPTAPAMALDLAKRIVRQHAGLRPPSCAAPAACFGSITPRFR